MELMNVLMITSLLINFAPIKMVVRNYQAVPEMDYQMILVLPTPDKRVFLDCQSFINAIYYQSVVNGEWSNDWSLIISGGSCDDISGYAKQSLDAGNPFCLSVDPKVRVVDISSNIDECL